MKFSDFSTDLTILDKYNYLCSYELREQAHTIYGKMYNIYDKQFNEFVFEEFYTLQDLLEIWVDRAIEYFEEEYLANINEDEEDRDRKKLYLHELKFIKKYWVEKGEYC